MNRRFLTIVFLIFLSLTLTFAQNLEKNCPPIFTHKKTINPEINIVNIETSDSNKYDSFPKFKGNIETISKKIYYPEIAKRAGVEGTVKLLVSIDNSGNVIKTRVLKGFGAGLEEAALDIIQRENFYPAINNNITLPSEITVDIKFDLNTHIDKPDLEINEMKYELYGGQIYFIKTIIFNKDGSAYFSEDNGYEPPKKYTGKINPYLYTKLNDFIIAQCFLDYEEEYVENAISHSGKTIITIKTNNIEKSVTSKGQLEPVGLWGIRTAILQVKDGIKWEEVKE